MSASVAEELVAAIIGLVEARDGDTGDHCDRIGDLGATLAAAMGLSAGVVERVRRGAALHDVGKVGVPDGVLRKPGPLDGAEWEAMRRHPLIGAEILQRIEALRAFVPVVLYHHERWDGKGYPAGLSGEEIPLEARIVAVVDAYAAMTEDRPYREGLSYARVLEEIRKGAAGGQFDPTVAGAFLGLFRGSEEEVVSGVGGGRDGDVADRPVAD